MFFKQIRRNMAKNRKGNGLFFGSLIIAIIAFYTLLSLGEQDVMRFLSVIESDAVRKLLMLLPVVYVISLFFVFFLVYFACRYQADSRRHEFGMYLMLGMKRSRMFFMLLCETLWNSLLSLLVGIPAALFLTEGISLATARIAGLGIIGHHISFSPDAIVWTICGFVLVQLLAMAPICIGLGRTEPAEFFRSGASKKQVSMSKAKSMVTFVFGLILLTTAYCLGIFRMRTLDLTVMAALVAAGILGTFFFYKGLGGFLGRRIRRNMPDAVGLETFTARQVQENVFSQHKSLAVCSLLLLMALSCMSYGISLGTARSTDRRSADFSIFGEEEEIDRVLEKEGIRDMVKDSYPMYLSLLNDAYWEDDELTSDVSTSGVNTPDVNTRGERKLDMSGLVKALGAVGGFEDELPYFHMDYVIAESSYNHMRKAMGEEEVRLGQQEVAVYTSMANDGDFGNVMQKAVGGGGSVTIDGTEYSVFPKLMIDNVVADRAITLYLALIVPDELYAQMAREKEPYCRNVHLTDEITEEMGLMQAVQKMDGKLAAEGMEYDSFLAGIGRNLFYSVAAGYLTIYLGLLFFIISNTVIGLKFLIQQRQTKHRYMTLSMLGADTASMCRSVRKQIQKFFLLVICVSSVSSIAAIYTMFTSFTKLPVGVSWKTLAVLAALAAFAFVLTEIIYIGVVKRTASREISLFVQMGGDVAP